MMMAEAKGSVRRSAVRGGDDDRRVLHWMEFGAKNGGGNAMMPLSDVEISAAASRAVLTHATFSIDECIVVVSASDHPSSPPNDIDGIIDGRPPPLSLSIVVVEALLDRVDVIDMSNPNMSRDDRARLTDEILRCSIDTPRRRTYRASKALHSKIGLLSPLLQLINSVLH